MIKLQQTSQRIKRKEKRMTKIVSFLKSRGIKGVNPSVAVPSTVTPKKHPLQAF